MPVVHAATHNLALSGDWHFRVILADECLVLLDLLHGFSIDMNRTAFIVLLIVPFCHLLTLIVIDGTCTIIDQQKW
ncbi:MAG: hypothetical protein E7D21_04530 [Veillonella sp.]|nr:hypothetical protein [Veillonella sp.]